MRRRIFCTIVFVFFVCVASAVSRELNAVQTPTVKLESTNCSVDLGVLEKESTVTATIVIKNKLDRGLNIREARSTCECLKASIAPQRVTRNGSAELVVTIDTSGLHGETENTVYILTDDIKYEVIALTIYSYIREK